ncbi:MAG: hypothetical protein IT335_13065 [Thermomicrobiales bacterium]|nr:hypothetical protein [Thermomicrobiales bacterium]
MNRIRLFLASDQMWPSAINATYPGARFVARARISATGRELAPAFAGSVADDLWGVLVETDRVSAGAMPISVWTDTGREFDAHLVGGALLSGDPQSVYMASRYWELAPAYIQQLREAVLKLGLDSADEEPRDDGALGQAAAPQG